MSYFSSYDYIIAGGGASGLSLLHHILQSRLSDKSILIIDKENKAHNDRTWCFWELGINPFEEIVYHRWDALKFHSPSFSNTLELHPYNYKMIRGIDFYRYVKEEAAKYPNVHFLQAEISELEDQNGQALISAGGKQFYGKFIFNSLRSPSEQQKAENNNYLLQHFKGWVIKTPAPFFDPGQATLMDFRVDQDGDCRFVYVLPTDRQTALVEYTLFSDQLLNEEAYDQALISYLRDFFQLDDYTIEHEEFGIIPMTDMAYPPDEGQHIVNIGTAGGITKPSTGYTFMRIQQDSIQIVDRLLKGKNPHRKPSAWQQRFMLYDSTLLNVMTKGSLPARDIFTSLFKNNPPQRVFKFLDEQTTFWEEIKVANSVPTLPFLKGFTRALIQ